MVDQIFVVLFQDKTDDPTSSWKDGTWEEEPYDIFASRNEALECAKELRKSILLDENNQRIVVRKELEGVYV